jgi:sugar/nucleoside kinase (ribokinase family)
VLAAARTAGLETSVDLVSVDHPEFRAVVRAALPNVDHLLLNEIEAGRILRRPVPADDAGAVAAAAGELLALGVRCSVAIHTAAGGAVASPGGTETLGALQLPSGFCRGSNGAGDAFAAGYLFGVHEGWAPADRLRLAIGTAAASLTDPSPSAGVRPVADCLHLVEVHPPRPW